ncbi:hypothetical protein R6Z07F_015761 [Ovis aries]
MKGAPNAPTHPAAELVQNPLGSSPPPPEPHNLTRRLSGESSAIGGGSPPEPGDGANPAPAVATGTIRHRRQSRETPSPHSVSLAAAKEDLTLRGPQGERSVAAAADSRTSAATGPGCPALACGGERRRRRATRLGLRPSVQYWKRGAAILELKAKVPCRRRACRVEVAALALVWEESTAPGPARLGSE